jgi:hypothetical protein
MLDVKPIRTSPVDRLHQAVQMQLELTRQMAQLEQRLKAAQSAIDDAAADIMAPELPPSEWKEDYHIA